MSTDLNIIPALQPVQSAPAIPAVSMRLPNGWTLSLSGPSERGEVWITFQSPAPSGAYAAHWIPADSVRGKVMLDLMRSMSALTALTAPASGPDDGAMRGVGSVGYDANGTPVS